MKTLFRGIELKETTVRCQGLIDLEKAPRMIAEISVSRARMLWVTPEQRVPPVAGERHESRSLTQDSYRDPTFQLPSLSRNKSLWSAPT